MEPTKEKVIYCISPIFPCELYLYDLKTKICKCKTLPLAKNVKGKFYEPKTLPSSIMIGNSCLVSGGGHPDLTEYFKETVICHFEVGIEWKFKITQVAEMLMGKAEHSLCAISEDLVLSTGGVNSKGVVGYCEAYSITKNVWAQYMPLTVPRRQVSSCTFNMEHVYAFCGRNNKGVSVNTIEKLKIGNPKNNWRALILLNEKSFMPIANPLSIQLNEDTILIAGGVDYARGSTSKVSTGDSFKIQESNKSLYFNTKTMQFVPGPDLSYATSFPIGSPVEIEGAIGVVDLQMSIYLYSIENKKWECIREATWNSFRFEIKSASDMTSNTNSHKY